MKTINISRIEQSFDRDNERFLVLIDGRTLASCNTREEARNIVITLIKLDSTFKGYNDEALEKEFVNPIDVIDGEQWPR